ncbi:Gp37 family protein [Moraxella bovoculi]|nr:Gp37 family protein [Moraxella bovoculi]
MEWLLMADSMTLAILASVREKLRQDLPSIEVDLFPDNPASYRFIHPVGAVLIGHQGSDYEMTDDTHAIVQTRKLTFSLTVFGRGVRHDKGAIALLDKVRAVITGFRPKHCNKIHLVSERYLHQDGGAWQYELKVRTETQSVEVCQPDTRPKLVKIHTRQPFDPPNSTLKKKNP